MKDKQLQVKCRNLIAEYEDVLHYLVKEEEYKATQEMTRIQDDNPMNYARKMGKQQGVVEGVRRLISVIYKNAKG